MHPNELTVTNSKRQTPSHLFVKHAFTREILPRHARMAPLGGLSQAQMASFLGVSKLAPVTNHSHERRKRVVSCAFVNAASLSRFSHICSNLAYSWRVYGSSTLGTEPASEDSNLDKAPVNQRTLSKQVCWQCILKEHSPAHLGSTPQQKQRCPG